jgi:hypothetical protein
VVRYVAEPIYHASGATVTKISKAEVENIAERAAAAA